MKVRFVVMVPTVVEEEYNGEAEKLADWARLRVVSLFNEDVPTGHKSGPIEGRYYPKLMEACVLDKKNKKMILLDEMIAPGGLA